MLFEERLLAPGPVPISPQARAVLARPAMHHRTAEFRAAFVRARERLAQLLCVPGDDVSLLAGAGTTAFEAAFLACVPPGATVVAAHAGKFGERWSRLARRYGHPVVDVSAAWGEALDPAAVAAALRSAPAAAAVTVTHSETSTGVLHDLEAIATAVRETAPDALLLVDAVTSLAATEVRPHAWGLDAVIAGSQKGVMLPPGLAFAWLSERAWSRLPEAGSRHPSFTLDLHAERARQRQGDTGITPPVPLVLALDVVAGELLAYGLEAWWALKADLNAAVLAGLAALRCPAFARRPSPAVAAVRVPDGLTAPRLADALLTCGVRVGGGQDHLAATTLRPSVLGHVDAYDALTIVAAFERALHALGADIEPGAGVARFQEVWLASASAARHERPYV
jgi:aspartate aminotransferase-like enzyme